MSGKYNILHGNKFSENGIFMATLGSKEDWNTDEIDITNMIDNKPIYYWKDRIGGIVPSDAGQVIIANCSNIVIQELNLSNILLPSLILLYLSSIKTP